MIQDCRVPPRGGMVGPGPPPGGNGRLSLGMGSAPASPPVVLWCGMVGGELGTLRPPVVWSWCPHKMMLELTDVIVSWTST